MDLREGEEEICVAAAGHNLHPEDRATSPHLTVKSCELSLSSAGRCDALWKPNGLQLCFHVTMDSNAAEEHELWLPSSSSLHPDLHLISQPNQPPPTPLSIHGWSLELSQRLPNVFTSWKETFDYVSTHIMHISHKPRYCSKKYKVTVHTEFIIICINCCKT